jgi:hypothetical protein
MKKITKYFILPLSIGLVSALSFSAGAAQMSQSGYQRDQMSDSHNRMSSSMRQEGANWEGDSFRHRGYDKYCCYWRHGYNGYYKRCCFRHHGYERCRTYYNEYGK